MDPIDHTHIDPLDRELAVLIAATEGNMMRTTTSLTGSGSTNASTETDCVDRLAEIAGRDRVIAMRLRAEAGKMLKLADALDANSAVATATAADLLVGDD
jgi:hypothetical protein